MGLQLCGSCLYCVSSLVWILPWKSVCVWVCVVPECVVRALSLGAFSLSPDSLIRCVKAPLNDGLQCHRSLRRINLFHWFLFRQKASVCRFPPPSRRLPAVIDGNGLRQINPFLVKIAANNPWLHVTSRSREALDSEGLTMGMNLMRRLGLCLNKAISLEYLQFFDSRWIGNDRLSDFVG